MLARSDFWLRRKDQTVPVGGLASPETGIAAVLSAIVAPTVLWSGGESGQETW
jgi:hypothetical protein